MQKPNEATSHGPEGESRLGRMLAASPWLAWGMPLALAATDFAMLGVFWPLAVLLRHFTGGEIDLVAYAELAPVLALHLLVNAFLGCYNVLSSPPDEFKRLSKSTLLFVLVFTAATFWFRPSATYSRGVLLLGGAMLLPALPAARLLARHWLRMTSWWGYRSVFYLSRDADVRALRSVLRRLNASLRPVALLLHEGGLEGRQGLAGLGLPVLSGPHALASESRRHPGAVFVFLGHTVAGSDSSAVLEQAQRLFGRCIILHESLDFGNLWARAVDVGNLMGIEVLQRLRDRKRLLLKTTTDLILSVALLLLLLPLLGLIAALIWVEDPGPVLFRHTRLGRRGAPFQALKFRTMRTDSEAVLQKFLERDEGLRRQWEERQKLDPDPRVTRVGNILRRTSLDELPQLVNVLRGEMSLIGPRPIVEEEVRKYGEAYALVAKVRPGLTGLWQVSGRNSLPYEERVALDVYYIQNWSIWLDLFVLLKTPAAVLNFTATS